MIVNDKEDVITLDLSREMEFIREIELATKDLDIKFLRITTDKQELRVGISVPEFTTKKFTTKPSQIIKAFFCSSTKKEQNSIITAIGLYLEDSNPIMKSDKTEVSYTESQSFVVPNQNPNSSSGMISSIYTKGPYLDLPSPKGKFKTSLEIEPNFAKDYINEKEVPYII